MYIWNEKLDYNQNISLSSDSIVSFCVFIRKLITQIYLPTKAHGDIEA